MAKTRAHLTNRALQKLLVVGAGQTADSEDVSAVDALIDPMFEDLSARDVYTVADDQDIEPAAFEWLALFLADMIAPDFGQQMDPNRQAFAESKLRRINASRPTYEVHRQEYF